jgi:hypothetical protein
MEHFKAFANEADALRIGVLEIENRVNRVTLTRDVVLSRDKAGLALARQLQALIDDMAKTLEADQQLSEVVTLKPVTSVKSQFV